MPLDPERWERAQALFHAALELPDAERRAFLARECGDDGDLEAEVLALLEADERQSSMLDRDLGDVAGSILEGSDTPYRTIGPYRLSAVLGQGGMGVVYLGEREDTGGRAAIKILRDAALSPARRDRFAGEQRLLAGLDHPSIGQLYDADVLPDGTPYFVMEYVEGLPLTEYCRFWKSSLRERLELFRGVCEAVQAAHRQAVVHRDLKPSNILVKTGGELKLLDFGIAKQLDDPGGTVDATLTGMRLMTPAYAAPEQVLGQPAGIYTDIYALGVLLYELLTGLTPLDLSGKTPGEAERAVAEDQPERPSQIAGKDRDAPRVTASRGEWSDLDVMCMTAMHKDPQRRYRTVQGLIRDIDHFLRGEPLDAQPDSLGYRARKFLRRNARAAALTAAVAIAGIALIGFYTVRLAAARDSAMAEAESTQRIQDFMLGLFQGGDGGVGPADTLKVLTLIDRGAREAEALEGEPTVQAELLQTLGGLYQQLGSLDRADSLLSRALARRREASGPVSGDVAQSLVALGSLRSSQARLDEAEALARDGLTMATTVLPPGHPVILEAQEVLGRVLQDAGKYDEATALLESVASEYRESDPGGPQYAGAISELANTHFYAGRFEAADSLTRVSLEIDRRLYGSQHPNVADGLVNLGAVQFQWGRYEEAERQYREALEIVETYHGQEHPETASVLTMLGRALNYQEKTDEALGYLERALETQLLLFGPVHPSVASTRNDIGIVALTTGDLALAEESYRAMAEIYDSIYAEPHWFKGIARSNLGAVYLEAERYREAEELFREAAQIFQETLSPEDMNTAIARIKLGRTLLRQGRFAEAESESRAGFNALSAITDPSVSWLQSARQDLAEAYEALGRPDEAEQFRAEAERYRGGS
jgi:serine/threonine-protein kinase